MALQELLTQRAEIDAQIAAAQAEGKAKAIAEIKAIMASAGITPADIGNAARQPKQPGAAKTPVAVKYSDAAGNTWTGRGLQPKWLAEAVAAGATREQFAVA